MIAAALTRQRQRRPCCRGRSAPPADRGTARAAASIGDSSNAGSLRRRRPLLHDRCRSARRRCRGVHRAGRRPRQRRQRRHHAVEQRQRQRGAERRAGTCGAEALFLVMIIGLAPPHLKRLALDDARGPGTTSGSRQRWRRARWPGRPARRRRRRRGRARRSAASRPSCATNSSRRAEQDLLQLLGTLGTSCHRAAIPTRRSACLPRSLPATCRSRRSSRARSRAGPCAHGSSRTRDSCGAAPSARGPTAASRVSSLSASAGTLGGGGGGGAPSTFSSSHLPRSTGEVRVA